MRGWPRNPGGWVVACVLCLGFWQLGEGAYIPAKAWLAQELMQRAWDRASAGSERPAPWPWADTWQRYHEQGMSPPSDEDIFSFE